MIVPVRYYIFKKPVLTPSQVIELGRRVHQDGINQIAKSIAFEQTTRPVKQPTSAQGKIFIAGLILFLLICLWFVISSGRLLSLAIAFGYLMGVFVISRAIAIKNLKKWLIEAENSYLEYLRENSEVQSQ